MALIHRYFTLFHCVVMILVVVLWLSVLTRAHRSIVEEGVLSLSNLPSDQPMRPSHNIGIDRLEKPHMLHQGI